MSSIPKPDLKCPTCHKTPNFKRVQEIINDAMAHRDNRPFDPEDIVIVSETEVYCSAQCYLVAVLREEEQ